MDIRIGKRLRELRKALGLTQKEFASRVKVDCSHIGKIERGHQYPSLKFLERIREAYDVPLGYFFGNRGYENFLDFLPFQAKELLKDPQKRELLKRSGELSPENLDLVMQIIKVFARQKKRRSRTR